MEKEVDLQQERDPTSYFESRTLRSFKAMAEVFTAVKGRMLFF